MITLNMEASRVFPWLESSEFLVLVLPLSLVNILAWCQIWNWRYVMTSSFNVSLRWRHNGHNSVSNHQPSDCLLNRLFRCRSKKTSKLCVTGLCAGNSPGTGEFPVQMASNAENVSIWWRHHACFLFRCRCQHYDYFLTHWGWDKMDDSRQTTFSDFLFQNCCILIPISIQ